MATHTKEGVCFAGNKEKEAQVLLGCPDSFGSTRELLRVLGLRSTHIVEGH